MVRTLRIMLVTFLLLAAGNALALGLGQIEVKSRINQPLLAEIPIVSTTPGELQALQVRLASPETFRRVGLAPPQGIAADLQFSLGNDARGRPVIRVTTTAPVTQAVLNFLIEVDWGQGRLVREYSALVDAPRTASAPLQPAISAPVLAAPNVVQRPVAPAPVVTEALPATAPAPQPAAPPPAAASTPVPVPQPVPAAEPAPPSIAVAPPTPVPARPAALAPAPTVAVPPAPPVSRSQYGPVKAGETLSKIAVGLDQSGAYTLDQTMLALLRANPDAFLGNNVNLLKQGAVLRIPGSEDRASISADEAQLVVRQQMQQWRQARRAVAQPGEPAVGAARTRAAPADGASEAPAPKPPTAAAPTRGQSQARLEIVPAQAPGKATGTRSGTNAGGEGSMLQQQLRQRDEDLAARAAEIGELKERVAELERLKQQQEQLLSMKDSELAAAQQRLAEARTAATPAANAAQPVQPAGETQATQPVPEPKAGTNTMLPWLWGSLAVLGVALLAWLLLRRSRPPVAPTPRRGFDTDAMAASLRAATATAAPLSIDRVDEDVASVDGPAVDVAEEPVIDIAEIPTTPPPRVETPTWHSGRWVKADVDAATTPGDAPAPRFVPAGDTDAPEDPVASAEAPGPAGQKLAPPSADQRLRLARAFLDIGDEHSATQLLRELVVDADPAARAEAAKLLRDLD